MTPPDPQPGGFRSQVDLPLAEALAEGLTLKRAADRAQCSESTAKRRWRDRGFRQLVRELQHEAREERAARLRQWWDAGTGQLGAGLLELVKVVTNPETPAAVKVAGVRLLWQQFAPREPLFEQLEEEEPATLQELFSLPESMDQAAVIDFGRALMFKMTGIGPPSAAQLAASLDDSTTAGDRPEAAEEAPAPAGPPSTSAPMGDWLAAVVEQHEEEASDPEPEPEPAPAIPLPRGPEAPPRWSEGLATRPPPPPPPTPGEQEWRLAQEELEWQEAVRRRLADADVRTRRAGRR